MKRKRSSSQTRTVKVRKKAAPKTMTAQRRLIRRMILKTTETKYKTIALDKEEIYHNKLYNFSKNLLEVFPSQGTGDGAREGDEIVTTGMKVRMILGQKSDRPNVSYKVWVVHYDDSTSGNAITYGNFFHNVTGNGMLDAVQNKRFKVLKAFTIKSKGTTIEAGETSKEFVRPVKFWIPFKKKLKFVSDASNKASNILPQMNVIVLPYDAYGTLGTDNIAYMQGSCTLYYKDP
ncbi:hypothetical protein [Ctenophore-associated circular virus 1]|uniref:hypothetical protein n=1 Tax=Ctenophore-associated circular virus 1 TaxID=1778558 RepID=UPI000764CEE3|nr:hypothetical protein [Ctenophore-associated circular virus 1]ALY05857.1 hypothetical protein [Ctenophore-associated circular virus 1]